MDRISDLEIGRSNMRRSGFRFRSGPHKAKDDWPVYCRRAVGQEGDVSGMSGGAEGSYGDFTYLFWSDGKLWQSYSDELTTRTRNTLTYTLDHFAIPSFDGLEKGIANLDLRTRDRWLSNAWRATRPASLLAMSDDQSDMLIRWHDAVGEVAVSFSVGEIVGLLTDPEEVAGRRQRERDFMGLPETKRKLKVGEPIKFLERDLDPSPTPDDGLDQTPPAPVRQERSHVVWLPAQTNGFQHPDKERTVYPSGVTRVALDHRPAAGSVLRIWGSEVPPILFGIGLSDVRKDKKRRRWEAELSTEDAEKIRL